jgi:hypothetical protein
MAWLLDSSQEQCHPRRGCSNRDRYREPRYFVDRYPLEFALRKCRRRVRLSSPCGAEPYLCHWGATICAVLGAKFHCTIWHSVHHPTGLRRYSDQLCYPHLQRWTASDSPRARRGRLRVRSLLNSGTIADPFASVTSGLGLHGFGCRC